MIYQKFLIYFFIFKYFILKIVKIGEIKMKERTKEFLKNRIFIFILGGLLFGSIGVTAATYFPSNEVSYDNTESGLSSTNVQGAIDELYNTCTGSSVPGAGGEILDKVSVVTSGDGLYIDEYGDGNYTYKGANPKNYVTFNNEKAGWRILSINIDGTIKILRTNFLNPGRAWDTNGSANWETASLNTYLNNDYYNSLSATAQSQIEPHYFGIWPGKYKIALASRYDVVRADSNMVNCGNIATTIDQGSCQRNNWIKSFSNYTMMWLLESVPNRVFSLTNYGVPLLTDSDDGNNTKIGGVRPVLYISSEVKITGGNGSQNNPYTLG